MTAAPDARRLPSRVAPDWIDRDLRQATGPIRPASILRVHEPDSPESIYLREQARLREAATTLKDSRQLAERLERAAAKGAPKEGQA